MDEFESLLHDFLKAACSSCSFGLALPKALSMGFGVENVRYLKLLLCLHARTSSKDCS